MRTIRYYVVNKNTNKAVFTDCRQAKCLAFMETLSDKENHKICYKWMSI